MKIALTLLAVAIAPALFAADAPEVLSYLTKDAYIRGGVTVVVPPPELDQYVAIVEEAAKKDPEWFIEQSKNSAPGVPLPYDPKLGLTEEQYKEYLEIWEKREFKAVEAVILRLTETGDKTWKITAAGAGGANPISTLKYDAEKDEFVSPNGSLVRLEDVKADKNSILGEWVGHEWRFEEETTLGKTKENFAIGKTADGAFGMLVYRMQEVSSAGTPLYDKSLVIRFPMGKAGILKPEDLQGAQPGGPSPR